MVTLWLDEEWTPLQVTARTMTDMAAATTVAAHKGQHSHCHHAPLQQPRHIAHNVHMQQYPWCSSKRPGGLTQGCCLQVHQELGVATGVAYRKLREGGERDIATVLLGLSSELMAFNFRDTFTRWVRVGVGGWVGVGGVGWGGKPGCGEMCSSSHALTQLHCTQATHPQRTVPLHFMTVADMSCSTLCPRPSQPPLPLPILGPQPL
jgi:hypothetical protein